MHHRLSALPYAAWRTAVHVCMCVCVCVCVCACVCGRERGCGRTKRDAGVATARRETAPPSFPKEKTVLAGRLPACAIG